MLYFPGVWSKAVGGFDQPFAGAIIALLLGLAYTFFILPESKIVSVAERKKGRLVGMVVSLDELRFFLLHTNHCFHALNSVNIPQHRNLSLFYTYIPGVFV